MLIFLRAKSANMAIVFAAAISGIAITGGGLAELARIQRAKSLMQEAVDAAALAAVVADIPGGVPEQRARDTLYAILGTVPDLKLSQAVSNADIAMIGSRKWEVSAVGNLDTIFSTAIGLSAVSVAANSRAGWISDGGGGLVALDMSGSMQAAGALSAAGDVVNGLSGNSGLVPFGGSVNLAGHPGLFGGAAMDRMCPAVIEGNAPGTDTPPSNLLDLYTPENGPGYTDAQSLLRLGVTSNGVQLGTNTPLASADAGLKWEGGTSYDASFDDCMAIPQGAQGKVELEGSCPPGIDRSGTAGSVYNAAMDVNEGFWFLDVRPTRPFALMFGQEGFKGNAIAFTDEANPKVVDLASLNFAGKAYSILTVGEWRFSTLPNGGGSNTLSVNGTWVVEDSAKPGPPYAATSTKSLVLNSAESKSNGTARGCFVFRGNLKSGMREFYSVDCARRVDYELLDAVINVDDGRSMSGATSLSDIVSLAKANIGVAPPDPPASLLVNPTDPLAPASLPPSLLTKLLDLVKKPGKPVPPTDPGATPSPLLVADNREHVCPLPRMVPPQGTDAALKAQAALLQDPAKMTDDLCTRADQGMLWAWRALSPKWDEAWSTGKPVGSNATPTSQLPVSNRVVLAMDGFNAPRCHKAEDANEAQTWQRLTLYCAAMKLMGVDLWVVTLPDPANEPENTPENIAARAQALNECSSSPAQWLKATDATSFKRHLQKAVSPSPSGGSAALLN